MEILFVILFAYLRKIRSEKLQRAADTATSKAKELLPVDKAKEVLPTLLK